MKRSFAKLSPFLRMVAAGMLLIWLAAVIACSTECQGEDFHAESSHMDQTVATSSQSHDSDNHDGHDDSLCISLHSTCPVSPSSVLTKPDSQLVLTLHFFSTSQLVALTQPETLIARQPPDPNQVFTPEVCLGPAFRSLAPPSLA